jgi:peroxin-5
MQNPYLAGNAFGTVANRFSLNAMPQSYRQGFDAHATALDVKGKGKFKETDFDAAFAQAASSLETVPIKAEARISRTSELVEELEVELGKAKLDDIPVVTPDELIGEVDFKRFVGSNVRLCSGPNGKPVPEASGSSCKILTCPPGLRKWLSGKQSLINI